MHYVDFFLLILLLGADGGSFGCHVREKGRIFLFLIQMSEIVEYL